MRRAAAASADRLRGRSLPVVSILVKREDKHRLSAGWGRTRGGGRSPQRSRPSGRRVRGRRGIRGAGRLGKREDGPRQGNGVA